MKTHRQKCKLRNTAFLFFQTALIFLFAGCSKQNLSSFELCHASEFVEARILAIDPSRDLGKLKKSSQPEGISFQIKNLGPDDFQIRKATLSCPCANVEFQKSRVAANQSLEVKLFLDRSQLGKKSGSVTFETNSRFNPQIQVEAYWSVCGLIKS